MNRREKVRKVLITAAKLMADKEANQDGCCMAITSAADVCRQKLNYHSSEWELWLVAEKSATYYFSKLFRTRDGYWFGPTHYSHQKYLDRWKPITAKKTREHRVNALLLAAYSYERDS